MRNTQRFVYGLCLGGLLCSAAPSHAQLPTPILSSQVLPGTFVGYDYGTAVAISGTTLVVGAPVEGFGSGTTGTAFVYEFRRGTWTEVAKLRPAELLPYDQFGASVAIDGDTIVVGAPGDDTVRDASGAVTQTVSNKGAAYVFRRTASGWAQEARLDRLGANTSGPVPSPWNPDDAFGYAVAVGGRVLMVGIPNYDTLVRDEAGAVTVFERTDAAWMPTATLLNASPTVPLPRAYGHFGTTLALRDEVGLAGAPGEGVSREIVRSGQTGSWVVNATPPRTTVASGPVGAGFNGTIGFPVHLVFANGKLRATSGTSITEVSSDGTPSVVRSFPQIPFNAVFDGPTTFAVNQGQVLLVGEIEELPRFLAGNPAKNPVDGTGDRAAFGQISALAPDGQGGFFVGDIGAIRHVTAGGDVTTLTGALGEVGHVDGPVGTARIGRPQSLLFDTGTSRLFIADGPTIRVMAVDRSVLTIAGSPMLTGLVDGSGPGARFLSPRGLVLGSDGALRLIDGDLVRRVSLVGEVSSVGRRGLSRLVDGPLGVAAFGAPWLLAAAPNGVTYVVDREALRVVQPDGSVRTILGGGAGTVEPASFGRAGALGSGLTAVGAIDGNAPLRPPDERAGLVWVSGDHPGRPGSTYPAYPPDGARAFGAAVAFSGEWLFVSDVGDGGPSIYGRPVTALRFTGDRWTPVFLLGDPNASLSSMHGAAMAGSERFLAVGVPYPPLKAASGSVIVYDLDTLDSDGDGLPDRWEQRYGLDPAVTTGTDGPDGDPDGDGASNAAEFAGQTHPRNVASVTRYFAEGARTSFFTTEFAIANAGTTAANVLLRYAAQDGAVASTPVVVPPRQRRTVTVPIGEVREFATRVESDAPVVVDRVMTWDVDRGYGSHGEHGLEAPSTTWYFAEGATHSGFDLFYLLYNPSTTTPAQVRVRYLRAVGAPLEKTYEVGPNQRFNIWVNLEEFGGQRLLAAVDVSARLEVDNDVPIIAERAMYRTSSGVASPAPGALFAAGHESAGITAPSASWFFAEGATNDFFDLFLLVANPGDQPSTVRARYLLADGNTFTKDYVIAASSRFSIWVDQETFDGHAGTPLANVGAVSTTLEVVSGPAVVAERAMWWPGPTPATWVEAHNSPGATATAPRWVAAAGEATSGTVGADTYYLIANPGDAVATVTMTLLLDDGTAELTKVYDLAARSRFSVDVRSEFPGAVGKRFSAVVTTASDTPIVVEWAVYRNALGQFWGAGANALATPVP